MTDYWRAPRLWAGERCFILGGGPSLRGFDASILRGKGRVLAINDAGLVMAPWADCLYFADRKWFEENEAEIDLYTGPPGGERLMVTRAGDLDAKGRDVKRMVFARHQVLAHDPSWLAGRSGGANAMNLAVHFGVACEVLLGFDMRPSGNWHDRHRRAQNACRYPEAFVPELYAMAPVLTRAGVRIINATPGSALECFEKMTLEEALQCLASPTRSTAPA